MYCLTMRSLPLGDQREILVWRRIDEAFDRAEHGIADARSDAADEGQLPDRGVDRLLVDDLLHLFEQRRPLRAIRLAGLLREQRVDLGIAAVGVDAILDDERLEPGRDVAERATRALH